LVGFFFAVVLLGLSQTIELCDPLGPSESFLRDDCLGAVCVKPEVVNSAFFSKRGGNHIIIQCVCCTAPTSRGLHLTAREQQSFIFLL